jgi:excisionase family DNA binding protein
VEKVVYNFQVGRGTMEKELMTVEEVAEYLGLKKKTVYTYVSDRRIPYFKIPHSNQTRFRKAEIDIWLEKGRVPTLEDALIAQLQEQD